MKYLTASICLLLSNQFCGASNSLLIRSPFLPGEYGKKSAPAAQSVQAKATPTNFKLKGITTIGSKYYFSIIDTKTGTSLWLEPNESVNGFKILSYNTAKHEIEYQWKGATGMLKLQQADGTPLAVSENKVAEIIRKANSIQPQRQLSNPAGTSLHAVAPSQSINPIPVQPKNTAASTTRTNTRIVGSNTAHSQTADTVTSSNTSDESEVINFDDYSPGSETTNLLGTTLDEETPNTDSLFGLEPVSTTETQTPPVARYKVKRNNEVENPNGHMPTH